MSTATPSPRRVFVSHETYTPARGGSASAEINALRRVFGSGADRIVITNTKGFTGHAMGAGIEDVVAIKALETGIVPPVPNYREPDPDLGRSTCRAVVPTRYSTRCAWQPDSARRSRWRCCTGLRCPTDDAGARPARLRLPRGRCHGLAALARRARRARRCTPGGRSTVACASSTRGARPLPHIASAAVVVPYAGRIAAADRRAAAPAIAAIAATLQTPAAPRNDDAGCAAPQAARGIRQHSRSLRHPRHPRLSTHPTSTPGIDRIRAPVTADAILAQVRRSSRR